MIYDRFQNEAIEHIKQGHSVIVSAPTGAGKTVIAEYVIEDCLARDARVIYTAPVKALSNQKYRQFGERFGDKIGILTGDVTINPNAPVLIMTTEIFRNKLLEKGSDVGRYSWIIFDEIHFLDDYERGSVWEESLIFLPRHMNFLGLSATVPNIDEIAGWIESIHQRPIKIVKELKRPVPLHFFYQCSNEIYDDFHSLKRAEYRHVETRRRREFRHHRHRRGRPNRLDTLIKHVKKYDGLPCIYFAFGRKRCEYLAGELSRFDFLDARQKKEITGLYGELCERFNLSGERSAASISALIERGIAYHHAGMLPTLKEVIERLFTNRLIKVIFTTETFSLGINMPARTVIFDELRKFYGRFHSSLKTRDFYQMAGRAGRRGLDNEGFVMSRVNPFYVPFQDLNKTIYGKHEAVSSRFNSSYATILHLYELYGENLYEIYPRSLHYFQRGAHARKRAVDQLKAKVGIMKELGYIQDEAVTAKGAFASKVYGYELPLSELYEKGVLENLSSKEIGILALGLVFEPRKGAAPVRLSHSSKKLRYATDNCTRPIYHIEKRYNITRPSKEFFYHLSPALEAWMAGKDFHQICSIADVDEGEIIRYFRMAIQILREILDVDISQQLKERTKAAIMMINRDVVDAERQLRL
ncbi:DEAD/DEAH box helicase [Candidatus Omnitrophota bacterium]